jgi:FMN phosphatase YigB (HAD superfamily)
MTMARSLVIFDIDMTLADCTHRIHNIVFNKSIHGFEHMFKKDWKRFKAQAKHDTTFDKNVQMLHLLQMFCDIKFFTGRKESERKVTRNWLDQNLQLVTINLTMRQDKDHRPDYEVKGEMYDNLSDTDKDRLLCIFEDRDQVVDMWRRKGLTCHQVCHGNY